MKTYEMPPQCADCQRAMELTRYVPKLGGLPELRIFMCIDCGAVTIKEVDSQELKMAPLSVPWV